mmetsp:Transcript_19884/g.49719  ORF Transcript_19884/g.49719 Transcript_19884/m.49719 type:complete len:136 (-) Transcript_19884:51-458(-)|eukprot:CAMPEP_0173422572 /NCGR_PEP_ID=MMETSP1357-20121228/3228_1 /TAXON_ID=77926 /ORGANISM="Hemiselmis rufescens, Strain PCC563" /LENGTH=135 /DNA_ID=CAMNT_0014385615 /DNA_START=163 /DNA_END=570 /DNA_ORIENTATION=+
MLCGKRTMGAIEGGGAFLDPSLDDSTPTKRVRTALQSGFMRYGEQWANQIWQDCEVMATEQHGTSVPDAVLHTMGSMAPVLEQEVAGLAAAELGMDVPAGKEKEWWDWWAMKMATQSSQQPPERERARAHGVCGF